jgi:hypothetical protein
VIGHDLGIDIVAEDVETEEQLNILLHLRHQLSFWSLHGLFHRTCTIANPLRQLRFNAVIKAF